MPNAPIVKSSMKVLLWNVKYGECAKCVAHVNDLADRERFDLICLTESSTRFLADWTDVLRSTGGYGYNDRGIRQKVSLWSSHGWSDIRTEAKSLPPGRFVAAVTNGIRVVGVCIPWQAAHVSSGARNRAPWEDHKAYLAGLRLILTDFVAEGLPVCVLGDYNQTIPCTPRTAAVFPDLECALGPAITCRTSGVTDVDGKALIDHVATTGELRFQLERTLSRTTTSGVKEDISDHPGLIGRLERA